MDRTRLLLLAGAAVAAAVVVVVVVLVVGTGGGGSGSSDTTTTVAGPGGGTPASAVAGVPQSGAVLGKATAPATLTVFEDPQCPYCRQWNVDTLPTVVQNYVRTGRVKIEYRGIVVIGENSIAGLRAIYGAAPQNKLWNMVEALYERQGEENSGWITIPVIKDAAREIGANPAQVIAHADAKSVTAQLNANQKLATQLGVNGTPAFFVQKPLGTPVELNVSGLEPDQFTPSLDEALR
ncbi:MAG TPA: DsbA family protein [Gaiellaceae bacterium]|nr:DsbA family protein [Gaiellaceae bacterium]